MVCLKPITANYFCKIGEIDLIMQDSEDIFFVEVRSRSSIKYGSAADSVTKTKQKKIIATATYFFQQKNWLHKTHSRFDIVGIQNTQFDWIKNAFTADPF